MIIKNKNQAIIVASVDGLNSMYTGVGTVVFNYLESHLLEASHIPLFTITSKLDRESSDFCVDTMQHTLDICNKTGGKFFEIISYADTFKWGNIFSGNCDNPVLQWNKIAEESSKIILNLSQKYKKILVIAHDIFFAALGEKIAKKNGIHIIWIPHGLSLNYKSKIDSNRLIFEKSSLASLIKYGGKVGYIGSYMKHCLLSDYHIHKTDLIYFKNGFSIKSDRFNISPSHQKKLLQQFKIPNNKKIIFHWGRCHFSKSTDILLPAMINFLKLPIGKNYCGVVIIPMETTSDHLINKISDQIKWLSKYHIVITTFEKFLPTAILQYELLDIVVFPSRHEANPIGPIEAIALCNDKVKMIYSNIEPLCMIFDNEINCLKVNEITIESLTNSFIKACHMPLKINKRNPILTAEESNKKIIKSLLSILDDL